MGEAECAIRELGAGQCTHPAEKAEAETLARALLAGFPEEELQRCCRERPPLNSLLQIGTDSQPEKVTEEHATTKHKVFAEILKEFPSKVCYKTVCRKAFAIADASYGTDGRVGGLLSWSPPRDSGKSLKAQADSQDSLESLGDRQASPSPSGSTRAYQSSNKLVGWVGLEKFGRAGQIPTRSRPVADP